MKVLTIKQPWAELIVHGVKDVENRTWSTNYRGRILIHTSARDALGAKGRYYHLMDNDRMKAIQDSGLQGRLLAKAWNNGAIIGEAEIVDCVKGYNSVWSDEGCYQFVLANPKFYTFSEIILDVKGKLGLWDYEASR